MSINWYGEGCFRIQAGSLDLLIDPFEAKGGLTPPRFRHNVLLETLRAAHGLESFGEQKGEEGVVRIHSAGEYDVMGLEIRGFQLVSESTDTFTKIAYVFKLEDIKFGILGHISNPLEPDTLEAFVKTDILMIPAGGSPFLPLEEAAKLIKKIEPKIVIPTFFKIPDLKRDAGDVKEFLKAVGYEATTEEKLSIKARDLSEAKTKVMILKA
ncbi:MAG: hypothetical protein A3A04_00240 [Candidatus Harrisonbacteria bacterium RIFCSPLOWO2_01_FULL_40_28]|uniref:Zn-dependent hydrolase n=2 Tax=Candidatus Harrisoniibacteriota TaxID=1817905 RepID=A0A1G1ZYI4_9BACT|nr:MAG: hypothetical protein A3A04_00240 [Candidatus Harrisonbacteria bacterium RIFCSPLOWO2_01_FULL_40_28]OGY69515.1 MAG: hypothetical protein A2586_00345 [Candidatus Harrisonbacteria bacterium RIFOXYD1_FULL_40_9]